MIIVSLEELFNIYKDEIIEKHPDIRSNKPVDQNILITDVKEIKLCFDGSGNISLSFSGNSPTDFCSQSLINFRHLLKVNDIVYKIVPDDNYPRNIYYDLEPV